MAYNKSDNGRSESVCFKEYGMHRRALIEIPLCQSNKTKRGDHARPNMSCIPFVSSAMSGIGNRPHLTDVSLIARKN